MSELSDEQVDAELSTAIYGYDPRDKYPEWSHAQMRDAYRAGREDALAEHRELLTVRSVEELDALPEGSVVKDSVGVIWEKDCGWWTPGIDMERVVEPDWVPALVLYRPDWPLEERA